MSSKPEPSDGREPGPSRRRFLLAAGTVPIALSAAHPAAAVQPAGAAAGPASPGAAALAASRPHVSQLTTQYLASPLGVDVEQPLLGWQTTAGEPGWSQSAYQIQVATSAGLLQRGSADIWDSGRVTSAQSAGITYAGPALASATRYYWSARVWDAHGRASAWSTPAWWETGLLQAGDWSGAQWLAPSGPEVPSLTDARWIWYPDGAPQAAFPAATRYLRGSLTLTGAVSDATLVMTADDVYTVYVNGVLTGSPAAVTNGWQTAQVYDVASALQPGANVVAVAGVNLQGATATGLVDTPAGLLGHLHADLADGTSADLVTDTSWKTAQTAPDGWEQPGFDDSGWVSALDEGAYGGGPWGSEVHAATQSQPAPAMRREFSLTAGVRQARLYISGAGYYVASINGERVGDHVLDPAPTVYNSRVLYTSYDVTHLVRRGANAIGVVLGRSFYAIDSPNIYWNAAQWLAPVPAVLAKLDIELTDGSTATVVTDGSWLTHDSPTLTDSVYNGETYDARNAIAGWDKPGLDTSDWTAPVIKAAPAAVSASLMQPVRVTGTVRPVAVTSPQPGTFVYKFPAMIAGWPAIAVSGAAGTQVDVRYGEILRDDGTVNNDGDPGITPGEIQHDSYILAGNGTEHWEPQFSYGSFQYIQIDGLPAQPPDGAILARVVHSDVPHTGDFTSSDDMLNTIHAMTRRTILNNLTGVPTDTPMYEKRGWFGDAQLYTAPGVDNFSLHAFLRNFLAVQADDQGGTGDYGDLAPAIAPGLGADPTWSSAGLVIPWRLYTEYGDTDVLAAHYSQMRAFVDYLTSVSSASVVNGTYGDWEPPQPPDASYAEPPEGAALISTGSYYRSAVLLAKIAQVLGNAADAAAYTALAATVKDGFNAAFLDTAAGTYQTTIPAGYRQASNAWPLYLGMVPPDQDAAVTANLVADITAGGNHLGTGIVGTMALFPVLTQRGLVDLAYSVATQTTFPSYGYWISLGATTLWEGWGSAPRSHDHAMFGTIDDWFFKYLAGIQPAAPGYTAISVRPYVPAGLSEVDAYQTTPQGKVAVRWRQPDGGRFTMSVTIPPNTTATVSVPASDSARVSAPAGAAALQRSGGFASYRVGSGEHTFAASQS